MSSPWALLANATLYYRQVTTVVEDELTGNQIPTDTAPLVIRAYFKKARLQVNEGRAVPAGAYPVTGYTVGILPDWAKIAVQPSVECSIDGLGSGLFYEEGAISVVDSQVEVAGEGSSLQGYFVGEGA